MSGASSIEWTDATWNPVRGCSRVSDGCRNCYAENVAARFSGPGRPFEGFARHVITDAAPGEEKRDARWTGKVELIPSALDWPLRKHKPLRIFVNSMSDLFHEKLSNEAIAAVLGVMAACPQHTFQILTKRPERMREWFAWVAAKWPDIEPMHKEVAIDSNVVVDLPRGLCPRFDEWLGDNENAFAQPWPLPNVWLGVSVENQATADERIPLLLQTPAAKRFVSYEPALGPVDFVKHVRRSSTHHVSMSVPGALRNRSFDGLCADDGRELSRLEAEATLRDLLARGVERIPSTNCGAFDEKTGCKGHPNPSLDWLIVGGESGPGARPFDVAWARSTVEQCRAAGVAVFVKQLGAQPFGLGTDLRPMRVSDHPRCQDDTFPLRPADSKGGDWSEWPEDLRVREFPA